MYFTKRGWLSGIKPNPKE